MLGVGVVVVRGAQARVSARNPPSRVHHWRWPAHLLAMPPWESLELVACSAVVLSYRVCVAAKRSAAGGRRDASLSNTSR